MSTTLTASISSTLVKQINAPQDGVDNVEQGSVNPAFQSLLDNTYALAKKEVFKRPQLSMQSLNGTQIVVQPFNGLWASKTTPTENYFPLSLDTAATLDSTNIEGGGGFAANTVYYVYATYDAGSPNQTKLVIAADPAFPDATLTFKVSGGFNQLNYRYIGSFICYSLMGTPTILPFRMAGLEYSFSYPYVTNFSVTGLQALAFTDITFTNIPRYAKAVKVLSFGKNNTVNDENYQLATKGSETLGSIGYTLFNGRVGPSQDMYVDLPVGTSQRLVGAVTNGGANVNVLIFWMGYRE